MFKKIFGKKDQPIRQLERPDDLKAGDMVEMVDSFGLPDLLKGQTLEVQEVTTYEYEHSKETEFRLSGSTGEPVNLTVENEDGEYWLNFTMKIERDEVESLFDMDAFATVFDEEPSSEQVAVVGNTDQYRGWLADSYRQKSEWNRGFFHRNDYRNKKVSKYDDDDGEAFETVSLVSDDDMFSIEIEVWSDGDTEVFLCVTRPIADVKSLYGKT